MIAGVKKEGTGQDVCADSETWWDAIWCLPHSNLWTSASVPTFATTAMTFGSFFLMAIAAPTSTAAGTPTSGSPVLPMHNN